MRTSRRYPRPAHTYYLDATAGNDANRGSGPDSPWQTIAGKVKDVTTFKPGDRILLKRGETWLDVKMAMASSGRPGRPIFVGAYGSGAKPVLDGRAAVTNVVLLNKTDWNHFDSLDFRNGTLNPGQVDSGTGLTFTGCDFTGGTLSSLLVYGSAIRRVVVSNCTANGSLCSGMEIAGLDGTTGIMTNVIVEGCTCWNNGNVEGQHGIYLKRINGLVCRDNTCYSNFQSGVKIRFTIQDAVVERNSCNRNQYGIEVNAIDDPAPTKVIVRNNICEGNDTGNMVIDDVVVGVEIYNNTLINALYRGVYWVAYEGTGSGVIFKNNLVYQDTTVLGSGTCMLILSESQAALNTFDNNCYYQVGGSYIIDRSGGTYTLAQWQALGAGHDGDGINSDPLLVDDSLVQTTTVDADSTSGQTVLNVASTTGFNVQDKVAIGVGTARQENRKVASIQAGVSLTMTAALAYTHTAVQADTVRLGVIADTRLQLGSPCIGAGDATVPVTTDFTQTPRGAAVDIGAYEYA